MFELHGETEETNEVDKTTDSQDGNVLALISHLDHVSDNQLGQDLKDHVCSQLFSCASLRNEGKRVHQQLDHALTWVDCLRL